MTQEANFYYSILGRQAMMNQKRISPHVMFYTKAGCHLCDEAREMLDEIAEQHEFELTETDIRTTPELFELYRYRIPVIIINDVTTVEGKINFDDLANAFEHIRK